MPEYTYKAVDEQGQAVRGHMTSVNVNDLYRLLAERKLQLVDCKPVGKTKEFTLFVRKPSTRDMIQLFVRLEHLTAAGVPLLEILADAREATDIPTLRDAMTEIHREVSEGTPLSDAFGQHPDLFGELFGGLISIAEATGNLSYAFGQIVKHLKWAEIIGSKVKRATRYPIALFFIIGLVTIFLLTVLVPMMLEFLKSMDQELPLMTRILVGLSDFVQAYWYLAPAVPVSIYTVAKVGSQLSERFAVMMSAIALRVPVFGAIMMKIEMARFFHVFSVMFQSGGDIIRCLEVSSRVVRNKSVVEALTKVRRQVDAGDPISSAMRASGVFTNIVVRMVKIGEDAGTLSKTVETVAEFFDRDVEDAVETMITTIEPAMTIFMAAFLGWVVIAVFGPIYMNLANIQV